MPMPNIPFDETHIVFDTGHTTEHNEMSEALNYLGSDSTTANRVWATPSGAPGAGDFRALTATDIAAALSGLWRTIFSQIASVTIANTNAQMSLIGTGVGSVSIPANVLTAGALIRIRAWGIYSSLGASPGTASMRVTVNTVDQITTPGSTLTVALTNQFWSSEWIITVRTTGGSGTAFGQGAWSPTTSATASQIRSLGNTATFTIDTTAITALDLRFTFGTADPANTITCTNLMIDIMTP